MCEFEMYNSGELCKILMSKERLVGSLFTAEVTRSDTNILVGYSVFGTCLWSIRDYALNL